MSFCIVLLFKLLQLTECAVFADCEFRAYVGCTHAAERILFRVGYIVSVMTFDVATKRTYLGGEFLCDGTVEYRSIQVCANFTHDEARPDIFQTNTLQSCFQVTDESVECGFVGKAAVDLFRAHLIGDGGKAVGFAELFRVLDEFYGAFCYQVNVDDFSLGDVDVHGGVYMDKVISGQDCGLEGFLHAIHGVHYGPFLRPLLVLEPGTAVVYGNDDGAGEVDPFRFKTDQAAELLLGHAGITAVAVNLVEGGCEIDGGVVALCCAKGCTDDGGGVGACCENGAGNACLFLKLVNAVKK